MRKLWIVALSICLAPTGEALAASMLASAPAYGGGSTGATGGTITCRIFNAGAAVTLATRQIFTNTGVSIARSSDSCNVSLGTNKYCAFTATIPGNLAFSCKISSASALTNVRGTAEISDGSTGDIIVVQPMN